MNNFVRSKQEIELFIIQYNVNKEMKIRYSEYDNF